MKINITQLNYAFRKLEPSSKERNPNKMMRILEKNHLPYKVREVIQSKEDRYDDEGNAITPAFIKDADWGKPRGHIIDPKVDHFVNDEKTSLIKLNGGTN